MLRLIGKLKNPLQRSFSRLGLNKYTTASKVLEEAEQFKAGDRFHGYTVEKVTAIPDFSMVAVQLKHDNTGAEHLHLARDDQNNVFSVSFRTTPMDSTGVPHILEHTTLCGSKKYHIRDPFFKMLNRSLSTFMNAWTASDYTMYPFSTQNGKDFSNLMSVYLDAAFFPNLKEIDFCQEGWRLENEKCDDPNSPIIFKGVVFNEMKGALSNAESWYGTRHQNLLLSNHTYGNISGGDPLVIPELTWNQLKEFHATHYHPSNSRFYTYGDLPLESHLDAINNQVLKYFEQIDAKTDIPNEPRWTKPKEAAISCAPDPIAADPNKQTTVSVSCMLGSTLDPFESFIMGMLSSLMVAGPNSPFYQALIEPNIGSDYSPVLGVDSSTKDSTFAIGLQGIHKDDVSKVVDIIQTTLEKIHSEGFEQDRIESILHRIELSQKHQTSNFGLGVASALMSSWIHGADPVEMLKINEQVDRFRKTIEENPDFLKNKVKEYFIDNCHRLTLVMNPEDNFLKSNEIKEDKLLMEKVSKLTDTDKEEIFKKGVELEKQQNEIQDISCLPRMYVKDIDKKNKEVHVELDLSDDVPVQFCEQPTNGITYFRAICDASILPYTLKPYLPLFCCVATKLGAGGKNYKELAQEIEMYTGGLSLGTHLVSHHTENDQFELGVMFSSHCLDRNLAHMFSLWQDIFNEPSFQDQDRLRTLINSLATDLAMSIADSGHGYAMSTASSSLTPANRFGELFGGLSQVMFMKEIAEKEDLEPVVNNLIQIAYYLFNSNDLRCSLNMTRNSTEYASKALDGFVSSINSLAVDEIEIHEMPSFRSKHTKTFIPMPFPVNYVSQAIRAIPYNHEDHSRLQILARLLSAKFLHREIREKGGAYGSGARIGGSVFSFFSYRDPNTSKTLKAFENSVTWARNGSFTEDDIEEAKLSVFSAIDSPVSPASKGMSLFTQNITNEMRQLHRDRLFDVSRNNIIDVAERYLSPGKQTDAMAIIGPENELHNKDSNWLVRKEFVSAAT